MELDKLQETDEEIHEIQIPSIAYDVIYAYSLKNQHFPFNRNIFLLMFHLILKHFCRC